MLFNRNSQFLSQNGSLPVHCPLLLHILLALPFKWNPSLHSYNALLLKVVRPLTKVMSPLGRGSREPQSTTAKIKWRHIQLLCHEHITQKCRSGRYSTHFYRLAHSHSTVHWPGMFSQLVHPVCTLCHMSILLRHPQRRLYLCSHGHYWGHQADYRKFLQNYNVRILQIQVTFVFNCSYTTQQITVIADCPSVRKCCSVLVCIVYAVYNTLADKINTLCIYVRRQWTDHCSEQKDLYICIIRFMRASACACVQFDEYTKTLL